MVDLPSSNGFTNIMVVVDYFIKMRYMVFINSIDAVLVAECFVRYVFKLYRLPNSIVSDYGS
jgi:Ca2+/Na+ antiporter